jgi:hypothetical protein
MDTDNDRNGCLTRPRDRDRAALDRALVLNPNSASKAGQLLKKIPLPNDTGTVRRSRTPRAPNTGSAASFRMV